MKKFIAVLVLILLVPFSGYVLFNYWSYLFAITVSGEVLNIERVDASTAILGTRSTKDKDLFSFAIAIKQLDGEIFTGSSEDRQWAIVENGQCVDAKFYPYPPWQLNKSGTYFNVRLKKLRDCAPKDNPETPL